MLLKIRSVSDKICRDNQNIYFMFINFFFENHTVYEIMCKNTVESDRCQIQSITQRMLIAYWITKARNTDSEYVIIIASPLLPCSHECASMLGYMYIARLVEIIWLSGLSEA